MAKTLQILGVTAVLIGTAGPAISVNTQGDIAGLCVSAIPKAAEMAGVPPRILYVLTLAETGRKLNGTLQPWPWAINHSGRGQWFASSQEMLTFADGLILAGDVNFDIGCFQLNYRWHGQEFSSLEDMADPQKNAAYAAAYLAAKYRETGSWQSAIGLYHSATQEFAERYVERFLTILGDLHITSGHAQTPVEPAPPQPEPHRNAYPLLVAGQSRPGPSLFPETGIGRRLIGGSE